LVQWLIEIIKEDNKWQTFLILFGKD
jgi:hypothetical protein